MILFGLFNLNIVNADVLDIEHNRKRISEILKVLEKEYELSSFPSRNDALCWSLFRDMQAGKNVEHISPVIEADRYEDLEWERYLPNCQSERYDITYSYSPAQSEVAKSMSEKERYKLGKRFTYTANFKLYKLDDLDNKLLLHEERKVSDDKKITGNGTYVWINKSTCKTDSGMPTHDSYDYFRKTPLDNYNGVIRYNGKIYTYDLWHSKFLSHQYSLRIYGFGKAGKFGTICNIGKNLKKGDKK